MTYDLDSTLAVNIMSVVLSWCFKQKKLRMSMLFLPPPWPQWQTLEVKDIIPSLKCKKFSNQFNLKIVSVLKNKFSTKEKLELKHLFRQVDMHDESSKSHFKHGQSPPTNLPPQCHQNSFNDCAGRNNTKRQIDHFWVLFILSFKVRSSEVLISIWMKTDIHNKDFAHRLALK